jgi:hypothetical protein
VSQAVAHAPVAQRLPGWISPAHPVFRRELNRWRRSRAWRWLRGSPWSVPLLVGLGVLMAGGAAALSAETFASPAEIALMAGGTFVLVLATTSAMLNWLLGLLASLYGAALVARERESQNWPFLRVTTLTSLDILGGKLAALLHVLARPAGAIVILRLAALLGGVAAVALAATTSGARPDQVREMLESLESMSLMPRSALLVTASIGGLDFAIWLLFWLIEPYFNAVYNSAIGLTASTLARTRGRAIALVFAGHLGLALVIYAPIQQLAYLLVALGFSTVANPADPVINSLVLFSVQFGLSVVLQAGAMLACLLFSLWRVERLGD